MLKLNSDTTFFTSLVSPIGEILLTSDGTALTGLFMESHRGGWEQPAPEWRRSGEPFTVVGEQLAAYFAGELTTFDVPLNAHGTPFQQRVWSALLTIPYGETVSYLEIARRIGDAKAVRAVGTANGRNPISIIVPCHRVIGASGALTGYGGGIERKRALLMLEARHRPGLFSPFQRARG